MSTGAVVCQRSPSVCDAAAAAAAAADAPPTHRHALGARRRGVITVAHKCQRPESPQRNSFKLLCCGFSGRWHFRVTVVCVVFWVRPQHNSSVLLCCLKITHNTTT